MFPFNQNQVAEIQTDYFGKIQNHFLFNQENINFFKQTDSSSGAFVVGVQKSLHITIRIFQRASAYFLEHKQGGKYADSINPTADIITETLMNLTNLSQSTNRYQ
ncbi:MAG TPA: hypothetical protein PKC91_01520 [Ignavibacteria bacterium]|nr:hypothetical protein [Ignavibacteria bacterium]